MQSRSKGIFEATREYCTNSVVVLISRQLPQPQFVTVARQELTHCRLDGQAVVMLSVLNAKAVALGIQGPYAHPETGNFDRDVLIVPDVELPDKSDVRLELRSLFDLVWQSAGFSGSPHYDSDGNWIPLQS